MSDIGVMADVDVDVDVDADAKSSGVFCLRGR
jgi:hypothetical protein